MDHEDDLENVSLPSPHIQTEGLLPEPDRLQPLGPCAVRVRRNDVVDQPDRTIVRHRERIAEISKCLLERVKSIQEDQIEFPGDVALEEPLVGGHLIEDDVLLLLGLPVELKVRVDGNLAGDVDRKEGIPPRHPDFQIGLCTDGSSQGVDPSHRVPAGPLDATLAITLPRALFHHCKAPQNQLNLRRHPR